MEFFIFLFLSYKNSFYISDKNSLPSIWFASIFSHYVGYLFALLIVSSEGQTFLILSLVYIYFSFIPWAFTFISKKPLPNPKTQIFPLMFSSGNFILLTLMFRSMAHFRPTFCLVWGKGSISFFCVWISSCLSTIVEKISFLFYFLNTLVENQLTIR